MSKLSFAARLALAAVFIVAFSAASPKPSSSPTGQPQPTPDPVYGKLRWREVGPAVAGGRVAAVAGTASDPFLYYLGAAGGGVWKSNDGGASWNPVFDKQDTLAIGAVAIDPANEKVVWAGTGEANPRNDVEYGDGLYQTTDGGDTWRKVGLENTRYISRIAIDPKNPNVVVVAAFGDFFADSKYGGIYRSGDGGKTWKQTLYVGPQTGGADLAMDPKNPNNVYAALWQFRRVPWTATSGGPDDGLYRSRDGGVTWHKLTGHGLPNGLMGRIGLAIAPSDPRRIYALIQSKSGILWRSDDGGDSWRLMSSDTLIDQRPFYFSHIAVDPSDPNHVWAVSELLSQSKNGGKSFTKVAEDSVHVDYHAIWIAPNDAKRIMVGEDGGYALSVNGGDTWSFSRNLTIGEVYHVGFDDRNPYHVCAPLQDNNAYCGPSNGLDPNGILNSAWDRVQGGDGVWAVPDPSDWQRVWTDLQDGNIGLWDERTRSTRPLNPWYESSSAGFSLYAQPYRFNWDAPIAIAPWDPHTVWLGGNVVFQTQDDGVHWAPVSPDLTRNIKAHQQPSGGPISLDVSSAEYSDNLLDIEGSQVAKGEIWVGTDDGLVQLTRDGGAHWSNVTPPDAPQFGRVETVAPSPINDGTAYAIFDDHRDGNYKPYLYGTTDFGKTWTKLVNGLPPNDYVRTVRPDIHSARILYAGTEHGMWISFDAGASWASLRLNLPATSVRDIRIQPTWDDLLIATHGRALYILDDITAIQGLQDARAKGDEMFPIRTAYEYHYHDDLEELYTDYAAANPPSGAIVDFYQAKKQSQTPTIEVLNASGTVIRTITGTHKVNGHDVPYVSNNPSLNRALWDFHENGPVLWMGAPNEDARGPKVGAMMPPGTYTLRMTLDGRQLSQNVVVKPDPRFSLTQADYDASYAFDHQHFVMYSKVDQALNALDTVKKDLDAARAALVKKGGAGATIARLDSVASARDQLFSKFTANYHNDEDSIMRPGAMREDLDDFVGGFGVGRMPTPAYVAYSDRVAAEYKSVMGAYNDFAKLVSGLNPALKAAGVSEVTVPPAIAP
jgi:photosystem II stability/assembly factor-like uncharacterized protein